MEKFAAVVLAAGKGTRMGSVLGSEIPKVMYEVCGVPVVRYIVASLREAGIDKVVTVVGYKKEIVQHYLGNEVEYAFQEKQLGTGHATMMAKAVLERKAEAVIVCYGDMPLFKPETIKKLLTIYEKEKPVIAMLSVCLENPDFWVYGRIVRNTKGEVEGIVEQKDCSPDQRLIKECNPGFYIFEANWFWSNLTNLKPANKQNEYYLTDMIAVAKRQGRRVIATQVAEECEALGINTQEQLKQVEEIIREKSGQDGDI